MPTGCAWCVRWRPRFSLCGHAGGDRNVKAGRGDKDKSVPDRRRIGQALGGVERHAGGIKKPAQGDQHDRCQGHHRPERPDQRQAQPAHDQIERRAEPPRRAPEKQFQHHTDQRQRPDQGQHQIGKAAADHHHQRRIGPRDLEIDRGMIDAAQQRPDLVPRRQMIGGRGDKGRHQRRRINRDGGDLRGLCRACRPAQQHDPARHGTDHADHMDRPIGDTFGSDLGRVHGAFSGGDAVKLDDSARGSNVPSGHGPALV